MTRDVIGLKSNKVFYYIYVCYICIKFLQYKLTAKYACTVCASLPYLKVFVPVVEDVNDFALDFELSERGRAYNSADTVAVHYCLSPCISDTSRTIRNGVRTFVHI